MHTDLSFALTHIGLSPEAVRVYLALLKMGNGKAQEIAKEAKINRSVAYKHLDELADRGLIQVGVAGGTKMFIANDPSILSSIVKQQQMDIETAIPGLLQLYTMSGTSKPIIRFYTDVAGIHTVYEEVLACKSKYYRLIGAFTQEQIMHLITDKFMKDWTKRRIARGVNHQSLRPISFAKRVLDPIYTKSGPDVLREIRYADIPEDMPALIYLFDDKVALVGARIGHIYATVIESKDMFVVMNSVYDILWATAKKPEEVEK